jgi:Holliday junction resolvase RusA-like endonuclease
MMESVVIELPWPGLSGNNHTRGKPGGGRYLTRGAQAYRMAVGLCVGRRRAPAGPLHTQWLLCPPDGRARDVDNVMKVVKDALTAAQFWPDDSNRVIAAGGWEWAPPGTPGGIFLSVRSLS